MAVLSEIMQATYILPGHFDWLDLLCYFSPLIVLLTLKTLTICITPKKTYHLLR